MALLGGPAGPVLTPGGRLGHGPPVNGRAGRACTHDGIGEPGSHGGAPAPLGPRKSVCGYELSAGTQWVWPHSQHEPQRQLLG